MLMGSIRQRVEGNNSFGDYVAFTSEREAVVLFGPFGSEVKWSSAVVHHRKHFYILESLLGSLCLAPCVFGPARHPSSSFISRL
jgi:hypothetical protein